MENHLPDIYYPYSMYDKSNKIHDTAIIHDNVIIGKNNVIGAYAVIGGNGEIRGVANFEGHVTIGDNNIISELVTIQRPCDKGAVTAIGNNNIIMAHSHIGHDVEIGDNCEICTGTIVGGYAKIKNGSKLKLGVTVRNRKVIGENVIAGMGAVIVKDIKEHSVIVGNPAKQIKK